MNTNTYRSINKTSPNILIFHITCEPYNTILFTRFGDRIYISHLWYVQTSIKGNINILGHHHCASYTDAREAYYEINKTG